MSSRPSAPALSSTPSSPQSQSPRLPFWLKATAAALVTATSAFAITRIVQRRRRMQRYGGDGDGDGDASKLQDEKSVPQAANRIIIGTRNSNLALWQAHHVADILRKTYPNITFDVEGMTTLGDKDQIKPLRDFEAKGVFTKELDIATLSGRIHLAVHSLKDLPTSLPDGLTLACVLSRGDTEDALVLPMSHPKRVGGSLDDLPDGAVIGTSALRRMAAIAKYYPKLTCKDIRGNVNTRLAKLDSGEFDGIILARTGLKRLGLEDRISQVLDKEKYGHAIGQGALAVTCRSDDAATIALLAALEDFDTRWSCDAERAVLRTLQGGCKVPITIRTTMTDEFSSSGSAAQTSSSSTSSCSSSSSPLSFPLSRHMHVWCSVMSLDGSIDVNDTHEGQVTLQSNSSADRSVASAKARLIGEELGEKLLKKGADKLLEGIIDKEGPGHRAPKKKQEESNQ